VKEFTWLQEPVIRNTGMRAHLWGYKVIAAVLPFEVDRGDRVRIFVTNRFARSTAHQRSLATVKRLPNGMDGVAGPQSAVDQARQYLCVTIRRATRGTFMYTRTARTRSYAHGQLAMSRLESTLIEPRHPIHAVGQALTVPVATLVCSGKRLVTKNPYAITLDNLDGGRRRLTVVTPEMRPHSRSDLADHRFCNQVKFLHAAAHAPTGSVPAVQGCHGAIRDARWVE